MSLPPLLGGAGALSALSLSGRCQKQKRILNWKTPVSEIIATS